MKTTPIQPSSIGQVLTILVLLAAGSPGASGATLTVTNLADTGPGTLRERIASANSGDSIHFNVIGTITLNSELAIPQDMTLVGPGALSLRVSGNNSTRVFHITSGTVIIAGLTIRDGRVVGLSGAAGSNGGNAMGGGVLVDSGATLQLSGVVLTNNVAIGGQGGSQNQSGVSGNGGNAYGGGVASLGATFLVQSHVTGNFASGGSGGAITDGAFPGIGGQAWGGGFYAEGNGHVSSSTVDRNDAIAGSGPGGPGGASGGGIYSASTMNIISATIVGNTAVGSTFDFGGGLYSVGPLTIAEATIVGNQADFGGGINGNPNSFINTILAGNSASSGPDGSGSITSTDYNLIQNTSGLTIVGQTTHNIIGVDPLLGPLQNNGVGIVIAEMPTMLPQPGSPVIDKGQSGNTLDQRGFPRIYDSSIPNAAGGNGADIGSVEISPGTLVVVNNNDSGEGSLRQAVLDNNGLGGGNTITFSNTVTGTIALTTGELAVNAPVRIVGPGAELLSISGNQSSRVFSILSGATQITGLTLRDGLVIGTAGGMEQNGFDARGGAIFNQSTLNLVSCLIQSNRVVGGMGGATSSGFAGNGGKGLGGAVYNAGASVVLEFCTLEENRSIGGEGGGATTGGAGSAGNGVGGAICSIGGTLDLLQSSLVNGVAQGGQGGIASSGGSDGNGGQGYGAGLYTESTTTIGFCSISGGSALGGPGGGGTGSGYGGGVYNVIDLVMSVSTIASNDASGSSFDFGGGIYNVGTLGITNSTIARNQADFGGGLHGDATAASTIFAGNSAGSGADVAGTINSWDYNLIQSFPGASIIGATTHTLIGQDPLLGPLRNNGGATFTMALLAGSPAIDQGLSFGIPTDQRDVMRPYDLPSVADAGGGDGSDIGAFEYLPASTLNIQHANDSDVVLFWSSDAAGFLLESATTVLATDSWTEVNTPRVTVGDQVYTTNSAALDRRFYRLVYP